MLAPVGAWIALRGQLLERDPADIWPALWLGAAVLTWVAGFDIIYACQDADFDRKARLHSIPARIGIPAALRGAAGCHLLTVVILATLPSLFPRVGLDLPYLVGTGAVALLLLYEHWLVRPDDLTRVNVAFFQVNVAISLGLFVIGTADMLLG
jgi:4-hydroxybenzoate polyprenyltransferase